MFLDNSFGRSIDLMQRSMDVNQLRRRVIANNIANSDTPNFKRSEVNFESEMKRVFEENQVHTLEARVSDERHIAFNQTRDYQDVQPSIRLDYLSTTKANGNNVDIEVESMNALQNQLMYELMVSYVNHQFQQMQIALR